MLFNQSKRYKHHITSSLFVAVVSTRHHAMPRVASKSGRIVRAAASSPVGQGQQDSSLARREVMLAALAAAFATSAAQPALAADCELQTAPDGLQYCDTKVGEGPAPVKGALIRWVMTMCTAAQDTGPR
jgi:hypothetical protein